jgi:hypothetical protein
MKASPLLICALTLVWLAAWPAHALDKVALAVQVRTEGNAVSSGKPKDEQARSLEIQISNRTREDLGALTVTWKMFGFDLEDDEVVLEESGKLSTDLKAAATAALQSKTVKFDSTRAHGKRTTAWKKKAPPKTVNYKRVEATGTRYAGWGVEVRRSGELIGEAFSRPDLKEK